MEREQKETVRRNIITEYRKMLSSRPVSSCGTEEINIAALNYYAGIINFCYACNIVTQDEVQEIERMVKQGWTDDDIMIVSDHTLWSEGYRINGDRGKARCLGTYRGRDIKEAFEVYVKEVYGSIIPDYIDKVNLSIWSCRVFNSEKKARKSFG